MSTPLVIAMPAAEEALSEEIEQRLAPHAEVMRPPPAAFDLETIKLVVEIVALSAGMVASLTEAFKNLKETLSPQQADEVKVGPPGAPGKSLSDVDEAYLRELLGVETRG